MKFLKNFLSLVIMIVVTVVVVALLYFEIGLWVGVSQLRSDARMVVRLAKKPAHVDQCRSGMVGGEYPVYGYQLRFEDNRHYVVEALCQGASGPFEVAKKALPWGIVKMPGFSGFMYRIGSDIVESRVVIGLIDLPINWRRYKEIKLVGDEVSDQGVTSFEPSSYGLTPATTSCGAWGYGCCQAKIQQGKGIRQNEFVSDCPNQCFERCADVPVVLLFTTDPVLDLETRVVEISKNQILLFSYSVQDIDGEIREVRIDFGDGEEFRGTNVADTASHIYRCKVSECKYMVKLVATDNDELDSVESRLSKIEVIVR